LSADIWALDYTKTLLLNDTIKWTDALYGKWIFWDSVTQNITIKPFGNDQIGKHKISIELDDKITVKKYLNFYMNV
jgi:hypothetical protein